jgi:hypothetical protein
MSTTISDGVTDVTPELVTGYEASAEVRHRVHQIIGGGDSVSLVASSLRTGTLECLFPVKADAFALYALLIEPGTLSLADTDHPELDMPGFVVEGKVTIRLDDTTRDLWLVAFGFRAVSA